jgi:hypothetical protein
MAFADLPVRNCAVQVPGPLVLHSLPDAQLRDHAANFGRLLEAAYVAGDRELALIFQRAMFDVVKLRQARRFGSDTPTGSGAE